MILIFVTFPNRKEATKIANNLTEAKLAGYITMFPVKTIYWWKGKKVYDEEIEIIIKTTKNKFMQIKTTIERMHSYVIPQIISVDTLDVNQKYTKWLEGEVK